MMEISMHKQISVCSCLPNQFYKITVGQYYSCYAKFPPKNLVGLRFILFLFFKRFSK